MKFIKLCFVDYRSVASLFEFTESQKFWSMQSK